MLREKPKPGDKVQTAEGVVCVVQSCTDDGIVSLISECGKHAFNASAKDLTCANPKPKMASTDVRCEP